MDASKAFDCVNHYMLFKKLAVRGVPLFLVRLSVFWYSNQLMYVKWKNIMSEGFHVTNGVRQGGVLSPYLFCVYIDKMSGSLNEAQTGCIIGGAKINHIMYADDIVLLSPSAYGLSVLLKNVNLTLLNMI